MCRNCRDRKKSKKVANLRVNKLCSRKKTVLMGEVNQQHAVVKPTLETSVFIGKTINIDPVTKEPIPGLLELPFVLNVHTDYTFDVQDGICILGISFTNSSIEYGLIKGTYKPLDENLSTIATGIRMVRVTVINEGVRDFIYYWQKVEFHVTVDESLISAKSTGFSELYSISEDGNIGEALLGSKVEFIQNLHLFSAPFAIDEPSCPKC